MTLQEIPPSLALLGMSRAEMKGALASLDMKPFRAEQIWQWLYQKGTSDVMEMSNLSKSDREQLVRHAHMQRPTVVREQRSHDGTVKWLFAFEDGNKAETVFIPETDRGTLCISSQVGCTLTCTFCHTGTQNLVRNLTAAEIVGQIMAAKDALNDWPEDPTTRRLTNIVLMGMGEPLFNYEHVRHAMLIAMDVKGLAFPRKKITLSTSGHVPNIARCADDLGVNLAISLHAVEDDVRDVLVPLNKRWKIAPLLDACRDYAAKHPRQRVTFEYVMLDGVNDHEHHARLLVRLIQGIPAKVNLIPFNAWEGSGYTRSSPERIARFARIVEQAGYMSPVRTPRGEDILAACGQLKSDSEKQKKSSCS
ncbi:MAG: 23S rRNA (adenine(2503)-C(2))-methyltransferase RlmN [Alphaproteobacteria bacterium]|nr:MAG: 23S rRNA (adenine(2503)-C(2))-methyltransferase RlmN [Alphaproteobacteria bacterium]